MIRLSPKWGMAVLGEMKRIIIGIIAGLIVLFSGCYLVSLVFETELGQILGGFGIGTISYLVSRIISS